jgi:hypothetical protein
MSYLKQLVLQQPLPLLKPLPQLQELIKENLCQVLINIKFLYLVFIPLQILCWHHP